jgi:hypothetical protein
MKQGYRQFICAGVIVLAAAVVITLCRAQNEEDPASPPLTDGEAAQYIDPSGEDVTPLVLRPDLKVHSVSAPSSASPGGVISVSDVTTNIGNAPSVLSVSDIYICTSINNVTSSCWVTNHTTSGIAPGKSWPWTGPVTVPANQPLGTNYYIVVANGNRQVSESNYANNTNYVMIIIN